MRLLQIQMHTSNSHSKLISVCSGFFFFFFFRCDRNTFYFCWLGRMMRWRKHEERASVYVRAYGLRHNARLSHANCQYRFQWTANRQKKNLWEKARTHTHKRAGTEPSLCLCDRFSWACVRRISRVLTQHVIRVSATQIASHFTDTYSNIPRIRSVVILSRTKSMIRGRDRQKLISLKW